jgi:hypothetical protein
MFRNVETISTLSALSLLKLCHIQNTIINCCLVHNFEAELRSDGFTNRHHDRAPLFLAHVRSRMFTHDSCVDHFATSVIHRHLRMHSRQLSVDVIQALKGFYTSNTSGVSQRPTMGAVEI